MKVFRHTLNFINDQNIKHIHLSYFFSSFLCRNYNGLRVWTIEQSPTKSLQNALSSSLKALIIDTLLRHVDINVKVTVASWITNIIWLVEIHS